MGRNPKCLLQTYKQMKPRTLFIPILGGRERVAVTQGKRLRAPGMEIPDRGQRCTHHLEKEPLSDPGPNKVPLSRVSSTVLVDTNSYKGWDGSRGRGGGEARPMASALANPHGPASPSPFGCYT